MPTYTPERLRNSADYTEALLVQRGLTVVTVETLGHIDQLLAHASALEEIARLKKLHGALERIANWRNDANAYDADMGNPARTFCEDVELIEKAARGALDA